MVQIVSLLLLAFAVSLDSFSVGFTYGLRNVKIPLKSIITIAICSAGVLIVAMTIGEALGEVLPEEIAGKLGGFILILLGAWILYQFFRPEQIESPDDDEKTLINLEIQSLGIVINILKKPMSADFDRSGTITGIEALMLGMALSLDAFGAGIGAAMLGFSPFALAVAAAVMSSTFVFAGMRAGIFLSGYSWVQKISFLPGLLLIIVGIFKL
ncbi:sporulation membrane protein YtaF [Mesobacillus maritimus]|uniref:Sporulation membrane protein YtaF n=1 Tax=Mesobacillus maritimus TaxID=1643336 RepID=A0ABS7K9V0_9BACI|nr:sporulation membrane protein YtaF [Mesobacillus maritimus]MBY0099037.1 sporulation membrane protein YtaF [Mesobacillus maritimus]